MAHFPHLLSFTRLGEIPIPNRVLMAPMTRFRVTENGVPLSSNALYYSQRASAGLIVTESLYVEPRGRQEFNTAGIHSAEQVEAWKAVTDAVHRDGGRIFAQLAHAGRLSHPVFQPEGALPIAPSALSDGVLARIPNAKSGEIDYVPTLTPRALETDEVSALVDEYADAAERARSAGFDGVELHAGSGHLHRQFLEPSSNVRTDRYGGSAINRCRFVLETLEAICGRIGAGRVGIKISPNFAYNGMTGSLDGIYETYPVLCQAMTSLDLAYVHVQNPSWNLFFGPEDYEPVRHIRSIYDGTMIAGGEFNRTTGEAALSSGLCDAIVFGRRFLANPDLPRRIALNAPENQWDDATIYFPGETGFTDYPTLEQLNEKAS